MPVIYSPGPRADKRQSTRAAVLPGERGFRFVSRKGAKALRRKKKGYLTQRHKEDAPSLRLRSVAAGDLIECASRGYPLRPLDRTSVVSGTSVAVRVDLGGRRLI